MRTIFVSDIINKIKTTCTWNPCLPYIKIIRNFFNSIQIPDLHPYCSLHGYCRILLPKEGLFRFGKLINRLREFFFIFSDITAVKLFSYMSRHVLWCHQERRSYQIRYQSQNGKLSGKKKYRIKCQWSLSKEFKWGNLIEVFDYFRHKIL